MKKIFEKEIDGVTVGFRFNMLTLGKACEMESCSVDQLYQRLGMTVKDGKQEQPTDLKALVNFFTAAAINYKEGKNEKVDFTSHDVADWLDAMPDDITEIMSMAFNVPLIKNQTAPQTGGR